MSNIHSFTKSQKALVTAVQSILFGMPLLLSTPSIAQTTNQNQQNSAPVTLSTLEVTATDDGVTRFDHDVTGLGKTVKDAKTLAKQQVQGIRDLVRYEAGVSVVEQGRGGSSGYAIYGVDKNRVAVLVDGLAQIQSYVDESSPRGNGSGAMNEIEIENIAAVEINKGSNTVEAGSGALGGSVSFRTKDVKDIIMDGKSYGAQSKTSYSSKDQRLAQTLAVAGQFDRLGVMMQYTRRKGHEAKAHSDINHINQKIVKLDYYPYQYDLREPNKLQDGYVTQACHDSNSPMDCLTYALRPTRNGGEPYGTSSNPRNFADLSAEEQQQYLASKHPEEVVSAKDYTGKHRLLPNPMDYKSDSYLARLNYNFNPDTELKLTLEDTKQSYKVRDMLYCAYQSVAGDCDSDIAPGIDLGSTRFSSIYYSKDSAIKVPQLAYTRFRIFNEQHRKQRYGASLQWRPTIKSWDKFEFAVNQQNIDVESQDTEKACSIYPTIDENCQVSQLGQFLFNQRVKYSESRLNFNLSSDFKFNFLGEHQLKFISGFDDLKSSFDKSKLSINNSTNRRQFAYGRALTPAELAKYGSNRPNNIILIQPENNPDTDRLDNASCNSVSDCYRDPIKGRNYYIGFNNLINITPYIDVGLGVRYDVQKIYSKDENIINKTYKNTSYNFGIAVRPIKNITLLYRNSTGFRAPSFYELYNYDEVASIKRDDGKPVKAKEPVDVVPEKAQNQEWGIRYESIYGDIEASIFHSKYKNMLDKGQRQLTEEELKHKSPLQGDLTLHNIYNAGVKGVNIKANFDLNAIFKYIPLGMYANASYSHSKLNKKDFHYLNEGKWASVNPKFWDAITPARYIFGLGYDHPDEKWGLQATWTHAKQKDLNELDSIRIFNGVKENANLPVKVNPKSYTIMDLAGYFSPTQNITLRLGINNVFNTRYTTWESIRQSTPNSPKRKVDESQDGTSATRYIAPGRNYFASMELKF